MLVLSHYVESRYAMRLLEEHPERSGYLLKERVSDVAVLVDALQRIDEGECVVDPTIVSRLVGRPREESPLDELTARELEVLSLMAEGHSNEGICKKLFLSPKTVETHVRHILGKLGIGETSDYHRRVLAVLAYLRGRLPFDHARGRADRRRARRARSTSRRGRRSRSGRSARSC